MSPAEKRFKLVVTALMQAGIYPSPTRVTELLGGSRRKSNNLNGQECRWRREVPGFLDLQSRSRVQ